MEILDNILIKNIRRFGNDVTIDIGPGATIFYAPNGTGKTSVFEAIELALTGTVRRLYPNCNPLIRDKYDDSSVRLNFSSGKYCQANLARNGEALLTGDHKELFGTTPRENVPYLLRLTHLLNQRGDGWLVQSESTDAGAQLEYLAIGREATKASQVMTSAIRAANALRNGVQTELNVAQEVVNDWLSLLAKRDSAIHLDPSRPLVEYVTLFELISSIAFRYESRNFVYSDDLNLIRSQRNELLSILSRTKEEWLTRSAALDSAQPMTEEYLIESSLLIENRRTNALLAETKKAIDFTIKKLNLDLSREETQLELSNLNYQENSEKLERLQSAFRSESNIKDIHFEIERFKEQVYDAIELYENAEAAHSRALSVHNEHQALFKRETALAEEKTAIMVYTNGIEKWREYIKNIEQLNTLRPNLLSTYNKDEDSLQKLIVQSNELKLSLAEAQRLFDSINIANSNIIAAIGVIASELPSDAEVCPICTQSYSPTELRRRMSAALDAINPELQKASLKIEDIKTKLNKVDSSIAFATNKKNKSAEALGSVDSNLNNNNRDLSTLINRLFPGHASVELVDEYYKQALAENESAVFALVSARNLASTLPSAEELAILKNDMDVEAVKLKTAQDRVDMLERNLKEAVNDSSDEISDVSFDKFNSVDKLVHNEEAAIDRITRTIESIRKDIENQYSLLDTVNSELNSINKQLVNTNTNITLYQARWTNLGLKNEPTRNLLLEARNALQNSINAIETDIKTIQQLEDEITRWQSLAEYRSVEDKIRTAHGRLSEVDYTSTLTDEVKSLTSKLELVQLKIETLNSFSTILASELLKVDEMIESINPLWNRLLSRIVIDPRFSATKLTNGRRYRKQYANINVKLNDENVSASHVASEAQITDLQLTFLLALAQNYEWMPWRALLLDDPTQHHDLVHASAVFDLLRDYIAEKDFQVLLATHDYVQAKFFMRKLQNDGIQARICTLQATSAGVVPIYK